MTQNSGFCVIVAEFGETLNLLEFSGLRGWRQMWVRESQKWRTFAMGKNNEGYDVVAEGRYKVLKPKPKENGCMTALGWGVAIFIGLALLNNCSGNG